MTNKAGSVNSDPGDTIIRVPRPAKLQPLLHPGKESPDTALQDVQFKIRLANTEGRRSRASYLIKRRYAWRGYQAPGLPTTLANRITLAAFDDEVPVATISVGIDSASSPALSVESLYPEEVTSLRIAGASLCEFTRLAVDNMIRSRAVLAAIFHIAFIYAYRIRECTELLVEVNPRHVRFYESMLGFVKFGPERIDPTVSAPAILLRLPLSYAESEIRKFGGHSELATEVRSLYPLFFSRDEELGIEGRIRAMD